MSKVTVATKSILVGVEAINIIGHLFSWYTIYFDIGGTRKEVLAIDAATYRLIVSNAPTGGVNVDWGIVMITNDLKDLESLSIYGVKPASAPTGELSA